MQCLYRKFNTMFILQQNVIFWLKTNYLLFSPAIYSFVGENTGGDGWRRPNNYLRSHGEPCSNHIMEEIWDRETSDQWLQPARQDCDSEHHQVGRQGRPGGGNIFSFRSAGGLYCCTADNGVTQPVERKTRIIVRRESLSPVNVMDSPPVSWSRPIISQPMRG